MSRVDLVVQGSIVAKGDTVHLLLDSRIHDHDTFLRGSLVVGAQTVSVRILTLDDVTVLIPLSGDVLEPHDGRFSGILSVEVGGRRPKIPEDLAEAARARGLHIAALDEAELRYALTFLGEATTDAIRGQRIEAILQGLPAGEAC